MWGGGYRNICILAQNINSLGLFGESLIEKNITSFVTERGIDILGIQELKSCYLVQKHLGEGRWGLKEWPMGAVAFLVEKIILWS